MTATVHIEKLIVINHDAKLDLIINQLSNLENLMSKTQEVIDGLVAAVSQNSSVVQGAVAQIQGLTAHVNQLLQAAADAPTLDETNALIAEAQDAINTINANSQALVDAVSANTPAEGVA